MFDRCSVPPFHALFSRMLRGSGRHPSSKLVTIGLVVAIAVSASLAAAIPGTAYAADSGGAGEPSIQYQEALAHADKTYSFTPGGVVTVPYRPRAGETTEVDGAAPIALPAGQGSGVAPSLIDPGTAAPNAAFSLPRREVLGFLPYWGLGTTLDYSTLSTLAYFGVGLTVDIAGTDPANDGALARSGSGWNGWQSSTMTSVINAANAHGTRVALTIESFAWDSNGAAAQTHLLSTPAASLRAAQQIAAEVKNRGAGGVNLDFEPIAPGMSSNFVAFVKLLRAQMDLVQPGYELTFCATGRPNTYDLPNLLAAGAADAVFIMGYNLRGGSPSLTGSIDPLVDTVIYDLTDTVNRFITQVPPSKVILGLPWYGEAWSTGPATPVVYAPPGDLALYGQPAEVPYSTSAGLAATTDSTHIGKQYENSGEQTAWTAYYGNYGGTQNTWRELYFDDSRAFGARLDAIDGWNLRGAGIWALGYDNNNGDGDLTNTIVAKWLTAPPGAPSTYHPITPVRLLDTRHNNGLSVPLSAYVPATFQVTGRVIPGFTTIPDGATAVTGNLTVTDPTAYWAVFVGPAPDASPDSSTINFNKGDTKANGVTVALGTGLPGSGPLGTLSATYMAFGGNTTNLVFDVTGYFTPDASGDTYYPVKPVRLLDTRHNNGLSVPLVANTPATFQVTGRVIPSFTTIPDGATAVTGNLTVTDPTAYWAAYIGPAPLASPGSSTINFVKGDGRANNVTVALGTGLPGSGPLGTLSATYMALGGNTTNLVFDVTGYFMHDANGAKFVPITPVRLLDSRHNNGLSVPIPANSPSTFQITGRVIPGYNTIPTNATAVTGNLTVTDQTAYWAAYIGPTPDASPSTSTINFVKGETIANGVAVALGTGLPGSGPLGTLSVTYMGLSGNTTNLVFDVTGYFVP